MFASKSRTKQLLIVLLAALLILTTMYTGLPDMQAYADEEITYTNSSDDHQGTDDVGGFTNSWGVTVSTDKAEYVLGEDIYVKLEGFSNMSGGGAWIGIFDNYAADMSNFWAYISGDFTDKVINNTESADAFAGLEFQHAIEPGQYYVIAVDDDGRWAIVPLTIKSKTRVETDKDKYAIDEPIMVTATSDVAGVWVSLLGKNDAVDAQSYYWYYVAAHDGEAFNIYEGSKSRPDEITDGEYKLLVIEDAPGSYRALAEKDIFIGEWIEPAISINKEGAAGSVFPFKYGEQVLLTAVGSDPTAWVGIYDYTDPDFPDTYYGRFNVKDVTGPVDLMQLAEDNGTPLSYGHKYRAYLSILKDGNPNSWISQIRFELLETYGDPTWTWDSTYTTATATFAAKHDPTITKTVTVTGEGITSEVTKEATEEEEGEKTYTATITADMIDFVTENDAPFVGEATEAIPKLSHVHTPQAVAAKDPTCVEAGNIAYYECTGCHKFFEDAEATVEIEDRSTVVIAALGHDWGEWTCDEASYETDNKTHSRECARCEEKETQACTFVITQSDPDFEDRTCSVCGGHYQQMVIPVITTDKAEYKVGEDIIVTTELNGTNGTVTGGWVALYQKGSQGSSYGTSLLWYFPDPSYWGGTEKVLQSVLHPSDTNLENLGEWPAAWGEKLPVGEYELVFLSGGKPYTMTGHPCYFSVVRVPVSEEVTKEPTCTEPGNKHIVYDDGTEEDVAIPALGHDFAEEWVHDSETRTHHHVCKRCGEDSDPEACVFDEGKVTKEPTETETGTKLFTCTVCGGTYEEEIPSLAVSGVRRAYGSNRYQTAMVQADLLKAELGLEKFDTIIVATGTNYADAPSGAYLGYVNKAPILLVNGGTVDSVKDYIKKNLNEGGKVYLLGGEAVVPAAVEEGMDAYKFERLAGSNRYATNIEILKAANVTNEDILVCDGGNFADSLSASAVARPILLVKGTLSDAQKEYLASLPGNNYYMIGGTGAVPASIENDIMSNYGSTARIGGGNRFETSTMVAEAFFDAPEKAVVAYAMNYPDGLCGGTLAAYMNAPLILVRDSSLTYAEKYMTDNKIGSGIVLGGPALIADSSARTLFSLAEDDEIYVIQYE